MRSLLLVIMLIYTSKSFGLKKGFGLISELGTEIYVPVKQ